MDEVSEHQVGDGPQFVDVQVDAENADEVGDKFNMILLHLEEKIGGRIAEDIKGYSKAIDIFEKHGARLPETKDSSLQNHFAHLVPSLQTPNRL